MKRNRFRGEPAGRWFTNRWPWVTMGGGRSRPGLVCLTDTRRTAHPAWMRRGPLDGIRVNARTAWSAPQRKGGLFSHEEALSVNRPRPWFSNLRTSRPRSAALAVAVLLLVGASCGDDDTEDSASTTSTTERSTTTDSSTSTTSGSTTTASPNSTSPTAATSPAEQEVIDRYVGYWNARFEANSGTPEPNDPGLREYATGAQLDAVIAETQSNLDQGLAFQRPAEPHNVQHVTVVELEADHAVVQECVVSDGVIIRRDTGEVVNDDVATHNVRGELTRVDGEWRVSEARLVQRWDGVAGCALGS